MATALVSVCEPRGCASATRAARQLSCRTSGQCSATATALVSACKPRGCACDYSSSPCLRMSTLSLVLSDLKSNDSRNVSLGTARYSLGTLQVLDSENSFFFLSWCSFGDSSIRVAPSVAVVLFEPDACRRRRRHTPPLASSPEANHKHLKTGFLSR